jgi:tetratricopeptide (TPR) repeat protein
MALFSELALAAPPVAPAKKAPPTASGKVRPSAAPPQTFRKKSSTGPVLPSAPSRTGNGPAPLLSEGSRGAAEFADAHPGGARTTASDLALGDESARKADALVAFAQAVVAGDAAETDKELDGYRKALALDPSYTELAVKVAYELAKRNDVSGGIQVLKDAVKAAPKEPMPFIYLSQLYSKYLRKPDFAMKYAEQALALAPDDFQALHAIYELHVTAGQPKKAEEVLDRATKSKSTEPRYWVQLGDLYTRLYLKEDGSSDQENLQRMNTVYRKAAELGKSDAVILAKVGDYFVLSRQVKEAIPFYQQALSFHASSEDPALTNLREKLARAFLVTEQKDEAIQMLETVVQENPMRFETYELLGELYQSKGDIERAMHNFEQTLLIDSSRPDNYLRLAETFLRLKRPEKAVETMRSARSKFPGMPRIAYSLAVTLSQAKRHTEAMTVFAEALAEAEESQEEILNGTFYFQYGAAAEQAGLVDKAAELMRESIRLDPTNASQAWNYLGYMWVDRDMNLDEAGEFIKKAVESEPDNAAYLDSLGWFYYKRGSYEEALRETTKAIENLKEEDAVVYEHLADIYQKLNKPAEALSYWQKSLALEDNPKVREKLDSAKQKVTQGTAQPPPAAASAEPVNR